MRSRSVVRCNCYLPDDNAAHQFQGFLLCCVTAMNWVYTEGGCPEYEGVIQPVSRKVPHCRTQLLV
jgi:hypothetical protein